MWLILKSGSKSISKPSPRLLRCLAVFISAVLMLTAIWVPVKAEVFDQYKVKAVFLYNLMNFITWPPQNDLKDNQTFTIGLLGRDTLSAYLQQVLADGTAGKRRIRIVHLSSLQQLQTQSCDLLFINSDQMHLWPQIREIVRTSHILSVSDVKSFCRRGGMVNLLTSGRRIRIEINREEARRNGFEISAKLLNLARIITNGKDD